MIRPEELLRGLSRRENYPDGRLKSCMLEQENRILTPVGELIPRWSGENTRAKHTPSVSFFPDGAIQKLALETQTEISTPAGTLPAELLLFYKNGALRKVFPLNGRLDGYWTLEDEARLCHPVSLPVQGTVRSLKIISVHFYPSGALKSLTLWPGETMTLQVQGRDIPVRSGAAFYEDGSLRSLEPALPAEIITPVGPVWAYDALAMGIHGESGSLAFDRQGNVTALTAEKELLKVLPVRGLPRLIRRTLRPHPLEEELQEAVPLRLRFAQEQVAVDDGTQSLRFSVENNRFIFENLPAPRLHFRQL